MNQVRTPRFNSLGFPAVLCLTTLCWSVSVIGSACASDRVIADRWTATSVALQQSGFTTPPHQTEEHVDTLTRGMARHTPFPLPSSTDPVDLVQDFIEHDRNFMLPHVPSDVESAVESPQIVVASSVNQPSKKKTRVGIDAKPNYRMMFDNSLPPGSNAPYRMMPLVINKHVQRKLDYFRNRIPERFQGYLDRFEKYRGLVEHIFLEFGLPKELGYLSLIESGFNPRAFSHARASGPWQFMKATGRRYGLRVTWYVDERRDPVKSTIAAAHHLRDLFDQFRSWPLALGAYNAGEGKIRRAIKKTGSRDFWEIRETRHIRGETKDYVPSFIAAALIASDPTKYGFSRYSGTLYTFDKVSVHKRAHLKAVAKTTGVSMKDLRRLNPELLRDIVPIVKDGYGLKVPEGKGLLVRQHHDQIESWMKPPPMSATWYRVRYGDTLRDVAIQFGLSVQELKRLNNLTDDAIHWNDRLRLRTDNDKPLSAADPESAVPVNWYRVRYGDTLQSVAQEFGLSVRELKRLNKLTDDVIYWNDRLQVRSDDDDSPIASESATPEPATWYRVRYGDTLESVAQEFGLSVRELKRLNKLTGDAIYWNDRLRVRSDDNDSPMVPDSPPSPAPATGWYRVRYGDTLESVAQEFGLSVKELKRLNNLKEDTIRWNDRLRVKKDGQNPPIAFKPEKDKPQSARSHERE